MSSTINASSAGIVETADSSGTLTIQTGGQTGVYIDASQNVTIPKNLTVSGTLTYSGGGGAVTTVSGGSTGLTPSTPASGNVVLAGTLLYSSGGTGLTSSGASGNLLVSTGSGWASQTPAITGLATLNSGTSGTQTFTGTNIFSGNNTFSGNTLTYNLYAGGTTTINSMFFTYGSINFWATNTGNQYNSIYYSDGGGTALSGQIFALNYKTAGVNSATNAYLFYGDGTANKTGGGSWGSVSDARLKDNVVPLTGALDKINALNPVSYTWKIETSNNPTVGFIAQEVENVLPNAVTRHKPTEAESQFITDQTYTVGFQADMTAYLVGAIKELTAEIEALKAKVGV